MVGGTTMQPLTADTLQLRHSLNAGDEVELTTTSGQKLSFEVHRIDDTGLNGEGRDVAYSDIRTISRKQISVGRTALLVVGIVALGAAIAGGRWGR